MEAVEIGEASDPYPDPASYPSPEMETVDSSEVPRDFSPHPATSPGPAAAATKPVPALERTATVLFDASWKKTETKTVPPLERQLSRPGQSVTLSWSNLTVVAPGPGPSLGQRLRGIEAKRPDKVILNKVSGIAKPGQLIAIMGASGAGKSTLLNVLASQNTGQLKMTGSVRLNGRLATGSDIGGMSAYVQQEDIFFGTLKVKEHLRFQAVMRMEKWMTNKQKLQRVDQVLFEMGLKKCEDTLIGIPGKIKGISGGEKKRLSFASEILTNPPLLFLDEPTSGLDSFMAEAVVKLLHKVAASGRTILCTIHQPSSEVYALFDRVLLLAEGRTAYLGPSIRATQFLAEAGHPCPENYNPADFYIHTLAIVPGSEEECKENVAAVCDAFEASDLADDIRTDIKREEAAGNALEGDGQDGIQFPQTSYASSLSGRSYNTSFFTQLRYVVWRSWLSNIRDPTATKVKFGQSIAFAILIGLMYLQLDLDESAVQNVSGALTFTLIQQSIGNMMAVLQIIPVEMPVFLREHRVGLYRTSVYFMSKGLADMPFVIALSFIFSAISYFMIGLRGGADHFFAFYGIVLMVAMIAISVGYCASAAAPSVAVALALGPMTFVPFLLFGGFFQRADTVKDYLIWMKFLSWFYYGFELLMINQWDGLTLDNCNAATDRCINNTSGSAGLCKGEDVLKFFGLEVGNVERDIGLLFALFFGARLLALIIMLIRVRRHES